MTVVKYMDKGWLLKANKYAEKKGWEETISLPVLYSLKEDEIVPISFMLPEDDERICITLTLGAEYDKSKAKNYKLHIPWQLWEKLPEVDMPEEKSTDDDSEDGGMSDAASRWLMN